MDASQLLPLVTDLLPEGAVALAEDPATADALAAWDPGATVHRAAADAPDGLDVVALLAGELADAGERAPAVLDAAVQACRPGGWILVAVPSRVGVALLGGDVPATAWADSVTLAHLLAERGLDVRRLVAPGAAARLAGRPWAGVEDLDADATPGLLDAGEVLLAVARTPKVAADRSRIFFSSITRKIVAAAVICRDEQGRLLVVFDTFRGRWTIPGGLVDADESPIDAAVREAREEAGVDVTAGRLLGVFAHPMPDRVHLVYEATPVRPTPNPVPLHPHEVSEVRWVSLDEVDDLMDAHMRRKLRECLTAPGRTWHW